MKISIDPKGRYIVTGGSAHNTEREAFVEATNIALAGVGQPVIIQPPYYEVIAITDTSTVPTSTTSSSPSIPAPDTSPQPSIPTGSSSNGGFTAFYTDILTGPNAGGENGLGCYLSIFGTGFGAATGKITIGGQSVGKYLLWQDNQIVVQPGPTITGGEISINGIATGLSFNVVPGNFLYAALDGSDSNDGSVDKPLRLIQTAIDRAKPGDHVIVRGGDWSDTYSQYGSFFSIAHKGGTEAAPIAIMAHPLDDVWLKHTNQTRGIHFYDSPGHFVLSGFRIDGGKSAAGSIGCSIDANSADIDDVRVINPEITGFWQDGGGAGAISLSGTRIKVLGAKVHDNGGSKLYHGIYVDARAKVINDIEIAYGEISNQTGGRGIQIYGDSGRPITGISVHHMRIHDIALDGIEISRSVMDAEVHHNIIYNCANPTLRSDATDEGTNGCGIRFDDTDTKTTGTLIVNAHHNTIYYGDMDKNQYSAAVAFDSAKQVNFTNNICVAAANYARGAPPAGSAVNNNDWFGAGSPPAFDLSPLNIDPECDADYKSGVTELLEIGAS